MNYGMWYCKAFAANSFHATNRLTVERPFLWTNKVIESPNIPIDSAIGDTCMIENQKLSVKDHPSVGKQLVATAEFAVDDTVCVYAGIRSRPDGRFRHLIPSGYIMEFSYTLEIKDADQRSKLSPRVNQIPVSWAKFGRKPVLSQSCLCKPAPG